MALTLQQRTVARVAVRGAGAPGLDLARFLASGLQPFGVSVLVVDENKDRLAAGSERLHAAVSAAVAAGQLKAPAAQALLQAITFTTGGSPLADVDLLVDAAGDEAPAVRAAAFAAATARLTDRALVFYADGSATPADVLGTLPNAARALVVDFHAPLERQPLVEIVPGTATAADVTAFAAALLQELGKCPLITAPRPGHAVRPVVAGVLQAVFEGCGAGPDALGALDAAAGAVLGMARGPLGNCGCGAADLQALLTTLQARRGAPFAVPAALRAAAATGLPVAPKPAAAAPALPAADAAALRTQVLGAYFGLAAATLEAGGASLADLDLGLELRFEAPGPFRCMNALGLGASLALVEAYAAAHPGFDVPAVLRAQAARGEPFAVPVVLRHDHGDVALVTIRRPRVLNALSAEVMAQLDATFAALGADPAIRAVVLTGFGTRAFVSGADITELAALSGPAAAVAFARRGQAVLNRIEQLGKPVVCAMNGLAFGGGNELAMACSARLARAGQRVFVGQPEPKLGIIPGYGGTQRLPRWVGIEKAWPYLRHANPMSSAEALQMGLIRAEVPGPELVERALELARAAAHGDVALPPIPAGPQAVPTDLPAVDIGPLSRAIDALVCNATLGGLRLSLAAGLEHEAQCFGRCLETEDMRIGTQNFLKNGPRVPAPFVHA